MLEYTCDRRMATYQLNCRCILCVLPILPITEGLTIVSFGIENAETSGSDSDSSNGNFASISKVSNDEQHRIK